MTRTDATARQDRIDEIRRQVAAGTYETPEKLAIAAGRLLESIGSPRDAQAGVDGEADSGTPFA